MAVAGVSNAIQAVNPGERSGGLKQSEIAVIYTAKLIQ
jgi:hypothetical protein